MSSDVISLELEKRELVGKKIKALREQNIVPAVIYDRGQAIHVSAPYIPLSKAWLSAGKHHPIELSIGAEKHLALIKDVDFEPLKHQIRHVTFGAVRRDEKTEAQVPLVMVGDSPAERAGLLVIKQLDQVEVKAFPQDIPDQFEIDATKLVELHDKITVGDLTVPKNVEVITDATIPIIVVDESRAHAAEEEEAAEAAEAENAADVPSDKGGDTAPKLEDE